MSGMMQFVIRLKNASFRHPPLGPPGRELASYIPPGVEWKQLNYGQGEGQVEVSGCEWGFYQTASHALAVELHVGELPAVAAFEFARQIAELTCGNEPYEIVLQGTAEP
jgi:hypothetical protein